MRQEKMMQKIMQIPNIEDVWDADEIMQEMNTLL
jgi:hypothetical protein